MKKGGYAIIFMYTIPRQLEGDTLLAKAAGLLSENKKFTILHSYVIIMKKEVEF